MKVWIIANHGYDFPHPEILEICSSKEIAEEKIKGYDSLMLPWNFRGIFELELDKGIYEQLVEKDDEEAGDE